MHLAKFTSCFQDKGLTERIVFIGSGRLGLPAPALMAFSMGADLIHVAREAMLSIGCIQAQICHTNRCPTGIATQSRWLQAGIDVPLKSERFYQYAKTMRKEILEITHSAGYEHPCQLTMEDILMGMGDNHYTKSLEETFGYMKTPIAFEGMQTLKSCEHLGQKS